MTNPTPHGQVPEALRLAHIFDNPLPPEWPDMVAAAAELRRQHARIAELEAVCAGGVQALSAAPGEQDDHQILAITTAYEQGVGKGHQAYNSGKEIANPYSPAYRCDLAWQYGYKEGKEQAQRATKAAPPAEQQAKLGAGYAELPKRRRQFFCTKCGSRECKVGTINEQHPPCECGYLGFAEDLDFNADEMRDFADRTYALRMEQATKETSGGFHVWRDISTAPKDGSRFVATGHNYGLYSEGRHACVAQWFRGCWMEASDWNETSELKYLTHWMPLPSPPDDVAAPTTQPAPLQNVSTAGGDSFLLLPTRPTPDAPANTAGLSWDAYSGAQMLAYGRSCSDAALVVAAPQQEAQEPCPSCRNSDIYACTCTFPTSRNAAPQPAPALSDDVVRDAARWRMVALIGNEVMLHPEKRTQAAAVKAYMDATHSGLDLTGAVDAALAAQGGNK